MACPVLSSTTDGDVNKKGEVAQSQSGGVGGALNLAFSVLAYVVFQGVFACLALFMLVCV